MQDSDVATQCAVHKDVNGTDVAHFKCGIAGCTKRATKDVTGTPGNDFCIACLVQQNPYVDIGVPTKLNTFWRVLDCNKGHLPRVGISFAPTCNRDSALHQTDFVLRFPDRTMIVEISGETRDAIAKPYGMPSECPVVCVRVNPYGYAGPDAMTGSCFAEHYGDRVETLVPDMQGEWQHRVMATIQQLVWWEAATLVYEETTVELFYTGTAYGEPKVTQKWPL